MGEGLLAQDATSLCKSVSWTGLSSDDFRGQTALWHCGTVGAPGCAWLQVDYCRQQCDEITHFSVYVIRPRRGGVTLGEDVDIATVQKEIMEYCLIHRMHVTRLRRRGQLGPKSAWSGCFGAGLPSRAQQSRACRRARSTPRWWPCRP